LIMAKGMGVATSKLGWGYVMVGLLHLTCFHVPLRPSPYLPQTEKRRFDSILLTSKRLPQPFGQMQHLQLGLLVDVANRDILLPIEMVESEIQTVLIQTQELGI